MRALALLLWTMCLSGCGQYLPATKGEVAKLRQEQSHFDAEQSGTLLEASSLIRGLSILSGDPTAVAASERLAAETYAHRRDADRRAQEATEAYNALPSGPSPGQWLGAITGALAGDWGGLIAVTLGALGLGGAGYGMKKGKLAKQREQDAVELSEMDPAQAKVEAERRGIRRKIV